MSDSAAVTNAPRTRDSRSQPASVYNSASGVGYSNAVLAYTLLRMSFGANIMLHGVSRLLAGRPAFLAYLTHYFEKAHGVPPGLLPVFATLLPWVETSLGLLLLVGIATRFSLIAGAFVVFCLVIGTNLAQDWLVSGLQLIYAFLYYYLLTHIDENRISLDALRR